MAKRRVPVKESRSASAIPILVLLGLLMSDLVHGEELPAVSSLPLRELPVSNSSGDLLAVMLTGDGGWAGIDKVIGRRITERGIPLVAMNSVRYFWYRRSPEEAAAALESVLAHYLRFWQAKRVVLVGFSRGAAVLPFMIARLPEPLRNRIALVALLAATAEIDFEFHFIDWFSTRVHPGDLPVAPEMAHLAGLKVLCIYGSDDPHSMLCPSLAGGQSRIVELAGGHHFNDEFDLVADLILEQLPDDPD